MEALWVFSGTPCFFLVPEAKILLDESAQLLPLAIEYIVTVHNLEDFRAQLERADIIVLVAEDKPIEASFLAAISPAMPKLVVISDKSPASVRQQLNALKPEGYLFGAVHPTQFSEALNKAFSDKVAVNQIQLELQKYTDIAFTAMSSASEMGVVALFAERTQSVMDVPRLAQLALHCFKDLNVEGVVQFTFDDDVSVYPNAVPEPYKKLLNSARMADARIISHGRFLVFSFMHVQLLIIDAPVDDVERYGRLRDILAPIVSITEARLKTLKVNTLLKEQQANTRMVMMLLEMASRDNRQSVNMIMTDLSLSLREMASGLELTLAQENAMMGLSEGALESLESLHAATGAVEEHFRSLVAQLDVAANLLQATAADEVSLNQDSKVELF
jgi:DNA-binding NarL/FixJ family response regulator